MSRSGGDAERQIQRERDLVLVDEPGPVSLIDSLGVQIRRLTLSRRAAYELAREYRRGGQLVPSSIRQEIAENGAQLRTALERYADADISER